MKEKKATQKMMIMNRSIALIDQVKGQGYSRQKAEFGAIYISNIKAIECIEDAQITHRFCCPCLGGQI